MSDDRCRVLLDFVRTKLLSDERLAVTADTRLVSDRVVDSMGLDLRAGGVETVADMVALIDRARR